MDDALDRFNAVSRIYDPLAKVIFGDSLIEAQRFSLNDIPAGARILVLGGGTGKILRDLFRTNPSCSVYYVEASSAMLTAAKKQAGNASSRIQFVHGTQNDLPAAIAFDVVITHFFLDMFTAQKVRELIDKTTRVLKPEGLWLAADFTHSDRWIHRVLLKMMYRFFRLVCGIEAGQLAAWENELVAAGFTIYKSRSFYKGFVRSVVAVRSRTEQPNAQSIMMGSLPIC